MGDACFRLSGDAAVSGEQLRELRERCARWNRRANDFFDARARTEKARRCEWYGQSADGRVWDDLNKGETRGLFNGASDLRMRWADRVTLDKQALLIGSLALANVSISGTGAAAQKLAGNMMTLLGWMRRSMGARWLGSWMALTNWYLSDTPAAALMAVRWSRERLLGMKRMAWGDFGQLWMSRELARARDEYEKADAAARVAGWLAALEADAEGSEGVWEMAAALLAEVSGAEMREARRAVRVMAREGEAEFAAETWGAEGPELLAKRFGDDFVVPDNCMRFDGDGMWFVPEWVGLEDLETRGWDEAFVEEVKGQGPLAVLQNGMGQTVTPAGASGSSSREGQRQVVWAYVTGVDGKGRKARYVCVFGSGEGTAFGWRMLRGRAGRWPAALFVREKLGGFVLDSRGVCDLASSDQGMAKALWDGSANNALLGNTPPILAKGHSVRNQMVSPLKVIGMNVNEEFGYMRNPEYPAGSMRVADVVERMCMDYFAMPHKEADAGRVAMRQRAEVAWFLAQACDVVRLMLELAQEEASDEVLAGVTDDAGAPVNLRRADILGSFGVSLEFNADDLDTAKVIEKAKAVGSTILAMDRSQVVDTAPVVSDVLCKLFPDVGPRALRSAEAGRLGEEQDEAKNLAMIRAGVMPVMNTDGLWNYGARLEMYRRMQAENPAVFGDMAPDKLDMLQRWMAALEQQNTQFGENRAIGRTGVEGVGE